MILADLEQFVSQLTLQNYPWIWQVFPIILVTLFANYVTRIALGRLEQQFKKTRNLWDDALFEAAKLPLSYLIWLMGFAWVVAILEAQSDAAIFSLFEPAIDILVITLLTWFVLRLIHQLEQRLINRASSDDDEAIDPTTVLAIGKLVRTAVFITASLVALQTLGYSVSGVLAFGGIGGIAVGFAAKDLLANFFGGLMVYMDRPFAIGDWIRSPDQEIEGTVEHIGWRQTRIRTFDKRPLYVPNSTFVQISVENPSRMSNRRIYETVGLRYDDAAQVRAIVADVKKMLENHPEIDTEQTLIVNFNAFAASSLDFFIYTFTKTTQWVKYHEIKQDVLLSVLDIVIDHGADIAYPTSTIKLSASELEESTKGEA